MRTRAVLHLVCVQWWLASRGLQQVHLERGQWILVKQSIQGWKGSWEGRGSWTESSLGNGQCHHHSIALTVLKEFSVWTKIRSRYPRCLWGKIRVSQWEVTSTVNWGEKHPESNGFSFLSLAIWEAGIPHQAFGFSPVGQRSLRRKHKQRPVLSSSWEALLLLTVILSKWGRWPSWEAKGELRLTLWTFL